MDKVKIVQIGTGHDHSTFTMNALRGLPQFFEVMGVAEPNAEYKEKSLKAPFSDLPHYTAEEALNLPGLAAVAIESDELIATYWAQKAAEKGLAVHLDKPGSPSEDDFIKLIETVKQNNLPFQMGYMYRYNPAVMKCMQIAKSGGFGEIHSVEAHMSVHYEKEHREEFVTKFPGGMMFFLGCHLIDIILQLQGEPEEIIPYNCCTKADAESFTEDFGFALFKYKNGVSFAKTDCAEVNGFNRRQIVVCGSNGTMEIGPTEIKASELENDKTGSRWYTLIKQTYLNDFVPGFGEFKDGSYYYKTESFDRYKPMMESFAKFILGKEINPYTPDYELTLFKAIKRATK